MNPEQREELAGAWPDFWKVHALIDRWLDEARASAKAEVAEYLSAVYDHASRKGDHA